MVGGLVALLLIAASVGSAAGLHAEAGMTGAVGLSRNWDTMLYARGRVVAKNNDWYDVSLVPIFIYKPSPAVEFTGGSYFTSFDYGGGSGTAVYRPFVAVAPRLNRAKFGLSARSRFERFFITEGFRDFNRFRQRVRIQGSGDWGPHASVEFFFTAEGYTSSRYSAGIVRKLRGRHSVEVAYFYESSKLVDGGLRHMIQTIFHFNFKGLAPD